MLFSDIFEEKPRGVIHYDDLLLNHKVSETFTNKFLVTCQPSEYIKLLDVHRSHLPRDSNDPDYQWGSDWNIN